jgi:hypothetical protein
MGAAVEPDGPEYPTKPLPDTGGRRQAPDPGVSDQSRTTSRPAVRACGRPSAARRHAVAIGTFANRRNQYVPVGNITVAPSCQPARAAA